MGAYHLAKTLVAARPELHQKARSLWVRARVEERVHARRVQVVTRSGALHPGETPVVPERGEALSVSSDSSCLLPLTPMSDLERYISDNALRVSDALSISYIARAHGIWQFFGLSDRSIVDYVVASGKHAHQLRLLLRANHPSQHPPPSLLTPSFPH